MDAGARIINLSLALAQLSCTSEARIDDALDYALHKDVIVVAVVTLAVSVIVFFLYKQLLFTTFDAEVAQIYGVKTAWVDTFFSLILAAGD